MGVTLGAGTSFGAGVTLESGGGIVVDSSYYSLLLQANNTTGGANVTTGNLTDSSPDPVSANSILHAGIVTYDSSVTYSPAFGNSIKLDNFWQTPSWGSAAIVYNANNRFVMGTGDFTIDLLMRTTSFGTYGNYIMSVANTDNTQVRWRFEYDQTGKLKMNVYNASAVSQLALTASTAMSLNTWAHVGVSRSSGTVRLFLNGSVVASGSYSGNLEFSSGPLVIGKSDGTGNGVYTQTMNIDEVRILKGYGFTALTVPSAPYNPGS